jgi:hypothetical protein
MTTTDVVGPADWIHPPAGVAEIALVPKLHYAAVLILQCDRLQRTLVFEVLPFAHEGVQEPAIRFVLHAVTSTRALTHELWPGGLTIPEGASREEQIRLVTEFKEKCAEVSVDWATCETALASGAFAVIDAGYLESEGAVSLRLDVVDGKTRGYSVFVRCGGVEVSSADGALITLGSLSAF